MEEQEKLVKSKDRVTEHGEVFTSKREVNAMLDLVVDESYRIESRFLEPACGEGNFLIVALERKMNTVVSRYSRNKADFEKYSLLALSSLYGIELLEDNAQICKERLFEFWNNIYLKIMGKATNIECQKSAKYIINNNILCGDALTLKNSEDEPIIFGQWDLIMNNMIIRRDYRLDVLLQNEEDNNTKNYQLNLFNDIDVEWEFQNGKHVRIPKVLKEFPPIEYWKVFKYE